MSATLTPGALDPSWAAAQTVHRLFHYLDDGQFDRLAGLFAPDGVWLRQGQVLTGPGEVLAAMQARPKGLATRHLVTNMVADHDSGVVDARYYATVFDHEGARDGPAPLDLPHVIFVCEDRLVESPNGWLFARRSPRLVFRRP